MLDKNENRRIYAYSVGHNDYNDFESLVSLKICIATGGTLKCLLTDETYAQSLGFDVKYKSEMGVFPFLHHLV